jgi:ubiquinone/menaquinone biosynthesis C-methylase UbiE
MFALTAQDLDRRIVDCAGGPSNFTATLSRCGAQVVACDPLYQWSAAEISERIEETYERMVTLTEASADRFLWHTYGSPVHLGRLRLRTMRRFLADYPAGREEGRYVVGALPSLPFPSGSFDLALCSHFLFTYSEQFSTGFHFQSLLELARIAREVRVFPLLTAFSGERSPHLEPVIEQLGKHGYAVEVVQVGYEFQKGGNQMLRVCALPA